MLLSRQTDTGSACGEFHRHSWFFATALAKQWDQAILYIEQRRLALWTHNKTIQKAIESYRITPEQKEYLRTLKIK